MSLTKTQTLICLLTLALPLGVMFGAPFSGSLPALAATSLTPGAAPLMAPNQPRVKPVQPVQPVPSGQGGTASPSQAGQQGASTLGGQLDKLFQPRQSPAAAPPASSGASAASVPMEPSGGAGQGLQPLQPPLPAGPATAGTAIVADDGHPRHAWDKLRWGMSVPEANAALGHMVGILDKGGRFTHQIDGQYKGYRLAFTFALASGLERLALMDPGGPGLSDRFVVHEELLILKYGEPFRDAVQDGVRTLSWLTPTELIQLQYRSEGTKRAPLLQVVYVWREAAGTKAL